MSNRHPKGDSSRMSAIVTKPSAETGIVPSLGKLTARLLRMVEEMRAQTGREPGADRFRGLYVSDADVLRYLNSPSNGTAVTDPEPLAEGASFAALGKRCKLSRFELDVLLVALAPDIEPQYERIYAYLQDDVSCKRPGIDLILNLLCRSRADKMAKRRVFSAGYPDRKSVV